MKLLILFSLIISFLIFSCTETLDKEGRVNPFDSNGDNWYPPVIAIDNDTINGKTKDYTSISVTVYDQNSKINLIKWFLPNDSIIEIDSIKTYTDTALGYDTIVKIDTSNYDTISKYDTTEYKVGLIDVDLSESKDTVQFLMFSLDSLNSDTVTDTVTFIEDADTIYLKEAVDSLFNVSKVVTSLNIIPLLDTVKTITIGTVFYSYSSKFIFSYPDTFKLFALAVDEYGIESEVPDSVVVIISDSLSNF